MRLSLRSFAAAAVFALALAAGAFVVLAEEAPVVSAPVASPAADAVSQSTISPGPDWFDNCTTASLEDYCQCHCKLCINPALGGGPENCKICQSLTCNLG